MSDVIYLGHSSPEISRYEMRVWYVGCVERSRSCTYVDLIFAMRGTFCFFFFVVDARWGGEATRLQAGGVAGRHVQGHHRSVRKKASPAASMGAPNLQPTDCERTKRHLKKRREEKNTAHSVFPPGEWCCTRPVLLGGVSLFLSPRLVCRGCARGHALTHAAVGVQHLQFSWESSLEELLWINQKKSALRKSVGLS